MPQRAVPAGKGALHGALRVAFQTLGQAQRSRRRRPGCARRAGSSSRSPARFTSRRRCSPSKAKTATSISSITLRSSVVASSAPRRCARSVALMALTCCITSPSASSLCGAARADGVVAFAHGLQQIRQRAQRRRHALADGRSASPARRRRSARSASTGLWACSRRVHSRISAT